MKIVSFIATLTLATLVGCNSKSEPQHFEPTVESLQQYECPEWFRDAKFGIWSCWNAYTASGQGGDWYARNMYLEGHEAYRYHCENYGHPSEFGYKDLVDLWTGENFNPKEQIELFKRAGAKYFVAMANHHDNFDLWDSKHQPWNSVNYGPKRDIIAEWRDAVAGSGLRWGLTSHLERTWSWFQVAKLADTKGPYKGVPYDGANPEYEQIYLPPEPTGDTSGSQPINATEWWREYWLARCVDLIDNYKPDLFYVDGGVPFPGDDEGRSGLKMISHLYNQNASWHGGRNEAVMCLKNWLHVAPKGEWGFFWDGIGTLDFEKGRASGILKDPWQTDTNLGSWTWGPNIQYRSARNLIHELVDVVSKNGNLLLNVSPRPDGTLDDEVTAILEDIGEWMAVNSESIYETRYWHIYGDGDLRVVKRGDDLYVTTLKYPKDGVLTIPFLSSIGSKARVSGVTMLANGASLNFEELGKGLTLRIPKQPVGRFAWVFKIEGQNLVDGYDTDKFAASQQERNIKQEISIWRDASIVDSTPASYKAIAYDSGATKWGVESGGEVVKFSGEKVIPQGFCAQDIDFTVSGYGGYISMDGRLYTQQDEGAWVMHSTIKDGVKVSISEQGVIWVVCKDGSLFEISSSGEAKRSSISSYVKDIAIGEGGEIAYIDEESRIRFVGGGDHGWGHTGMNVTAIDYTPKTGHLLAVYDGELSVYKEREWIFLEVEARSVAGGKSNDDEIIGWIE